MMIYVKKSGSGNVRYTNPRAGFSLVEMIVAMSIFVAAMSVIVGIFIQGLRSQRVVTNMIAVTSDTSLALEQIAREIRAGRNFKLLEPVDPACNMSPDPLHPVFSHGIDFFRKKGDALVKITYRWDAAGKSVLRGEDDSNFQPVIAIPDVAMKRFCFSMNHGANPDPNDPGALYDATPWRVTFSGIVGSARAQALAQDITIQTTVVSRVLPDDIAASPAP